MPRPNEEEMIRRFLPPGREAGWAERQWPAVVVLDRYTGAYSRGKWWAMPLDILDDEVPVDPMCGDMVCDEFWLNVRDGKYWPVGVGATPSDAFDDLVRQVEEEAKHAQGTTT